MGADLLAGAIYAKVEAPPVAPTILVFDSGLGGLTVYAEVVKARPDATFVYVADDAAFPYGALSEQTLKSRVLSVMERLIGLYTPDCVVIACNTASTLVLPALRAHFPIPFIGTVPAIKPAVQASQSKRVSVLATPGTVARDYTHDLIEAYAGDTEVTLVGSPHLAAYAEAEMAGEPVADHLIEAEIAPCFVERAGKRTDAVVLACTHYPLLCHRFKALAPWPVVWIDPAPAIARRVTELIGEKPDRAELQSKQEPVAVFTSGKGLKPSLLTALNARGLGRCVVEVVS